MSERSEITRTPVTTMENGEGGETEGRSMAPPAFSLTASAAATPPTDGGADVAQLTPDQTVAAPEALAPGDWNDFYQEFNREFAPVLQILGPDEHEGGERVSLEKLRTKFSQREVRLLLDFCRTQFIPDGLWNTGEPCATNARERILLASHILDQGLIRHGSMVQDLHARMCGHWATLVYAYAGTTREVGPSASGVMGNFDHSGHVVFGTGTVTGGMGSRVELDALPEGQQDDIGEIQEGTGHATAVAAARASGDAERLRRFARLRGIPSGQFNSIEAGDWLWIYNGNGSGLGAHSIIFSHWTTDPVPGPEGGMCRKGVAYSQGHPAEGGRRHEIEVGDRFYFTEAPYRCISPIINWIHINQEAHAASTIEEILQMDPPSAAPEVTAAPPRGRRPRRDMSVRGRNETLLMQAARGSESINVQGLYADLIAEINGYMGVLAPRMSAHQISVITPYLEPRSGDTIDFGYLEILVRLIQRLKPMATNAAILTANTASSEDGVAERYARTAPARLESIGTNNAVARTKMAELSPTLEQMLLLSDDFVGHGRLTEISALFTMLDSQYDEVQASSVQALEGERLATSFAGGEGLAAEIQAAMRPTEAGGEPLSRGAAFERVLAAHGMDLGQYDRATNAAAAFARGAVAIVSTLTTLQQTVGGSNRRIPAIRSYRALFRDAAPQIARLRVLSRTLREGNRATASYHLAHPGNIRGADTTTGVTGLLGAVRPVGRLRGLVRGG